MWKPPECTVSGGFFLLVGWFALCCGWQMALTVLGAAAWHEFGHLLALRLCGGEARRLRVGMLGAVIEVRGAMGYGQELASALAGPLANLLAAAILGRMGCTTAAGANGVLCAFNLLPVRPLDGGRALRCALTRFCPKWANRIAIWAEWGTIGILGALALAATFYWKLGMLPMTAVTLLAIKAFLRKRPCKLTRFGVQ